MPHMFVLPLRIKAHKSQRINGSVEIHLSRPVCSELRLRPGSRSGPELPPGFVGSLGSDRRRSGAGPDLGLGSPADVTASLEPSGKRSPSSPPSSSLTTRLADSPTLPGRPDRVLRDLALRHHPEYSSPPRSRLFASPTSTPQTAPPRLRVRAAARANALAQRQINKLR